MASITCIIRLTSLGGMVVAILLHFLFMILNPLRAGCISRLLSILHLRVIILWCVRLFPGLFDYHPLSIPAPYNHSNIDSDEVLYYVDGDFMSRKHVTRGMITLHPGGIPHGPHPGAVEKSIGMKETKELAVMVDTFHPLQLTKEALEIEDENYVMSWAE